MTFEQFKKIIYHTRNCIRIPGSRSVIDKTQVMTKGKLDNKKIEKILKKVYDEEEFINK
jgi:N-acetylglutamate synthase/N-acetylornithine aminotransferase